MANMVNTLENEFLDGILGIEQYVSPTSAFLALFSANPTDTGSVVNELSGGGYIRVDLDSKFSAATGTDGSSLNVSDISFPSATEVWLTATHAAIMKSSVIGTDDMVMVIELITPISILSGEVFSFEVGTLAITAG